MQIGFKNGIVLTYGNIKKITMNLYLFSITIAIIVILGSLFFYIFRGIFKSSKKIKFYHKSRLFGENKFEQDKDE